MIEILILHTRIIITCFHTLQQTFFALCSYPVPQMELIMNFWLSPSAKKRQNPCSQPPPVFQDLSTHHDWHVKKAIVNLPVRLKGNLKFILDKSLSLLGAKN